MGKLEESRKMHNELELDLKKQQEQNLESEKNFSEQLKTLQEALEEQVSKHKELVSVKEAFDGLNLELESSRKKMAEFEQELQLSADEKRKFEDLHKESGSLAESETKRALEFERLLEVARLSAKEMEDQMASLQGELQGLYEKIAENEKVEAALRRTSMELSETLEELQATKGNFLDLEKTISSKDALINEMAKELEQLKLSEDQLKECVSAMGLLLSSTKDDLQTKISELEEIQLKLKEEVSSRELVEAALKTQEEQVVMLKEELAREASEKQMLEETVMELTNNMSQMKDKNIDLETKLKVSDENFGKADSLLAEALARHTELEQKLKSLQGLHEESGAAAAAAAQKNLELEDIIQAANAATEEVKLQLQVLESRFKASEERNIKLEQQLNLVESKHSDTERELMEYSEKLSELSMKLKALESEKEQANGQMEDQRNKIAELESALTQSTLHHSELRAELKHVNEKCAEHEGRANATHQRSLELEDLIQSSHSKIEDADKKVGELEALLETEKSRIQELGEQICTLEKKCEEAEAESKKYSAMASELKSELENFQSATSSLETALQEASEKERVLTDSLNVSEEKKRHAEEELSSSIKKLQETEDLLEGMRNELALTEEKIESMENDLKAAGTREGEIMEKLKSAEDQSEQQGKVIKLAAARNKELESLYDTLVRDSELKIQEMMTNFTNKDSEAKVFSEKLKLLEDQIQIYQAQIAEATQKAASLTEELDQSTTKVADLESSNKELRRVIVEAEEKAAQSLTENSLLVDTNTQLKNKVNELQVLLDSAIAEKEATVQQVASHLSTISELTEQHTRSRELHSAAEAHSIEIQTQLEETYQKFLQKELEVKELNERLAAIEGQMNRYEEEARELAGVADSRKLELEQTLLKLQDREKLVEELQVKLGQLETDAGALAASLTEELDRSTTKVADLESSNEELRRAIVEAEEKAAQSLTEKSLLVDSNTQLKNKVNELQVLLDSAIAEKEATVQQVASHVSTISELTEQHTRSRELHSAAEAHIIEIQTQLEETAQKFLHKGLEVKELTERLAATEGQMNRYEEEARELAGVADSRKLELEQTLLKLRDREKMVEELQVKLGQLETDTGALAASLTGELDRSTTKVADLESSNEELRRAIVEAEEKAAQSLSENSVLVDTNTQLKSKVNELQVLLDSAIAEKEATAQQVASHVSTISELTEQHTRSSELHSAAEAHIIEIQTQLEETAQKFLHKGLEVKELTERLAATEGQMNRYEEEAREIAGVADSRKLELEQTLLKLRDREKLVEELQVKLGQLETDTGALAASLTGELDRSTTKVADLESSNEELRRAIVEAEEKAAQSLTEKSLLVDSNTQLKNKVNELQVLLDSAIAEKEATVQQVASHVSTISELTEQHTRSSELHSAAEAHIIEIQTQLEETAQKFLHKGLEVKELTERLAATEGQMNRYEEEARELAGVADSRKLELEQTLLKLQDREKMVEELQVKLGQLETDTGALAASLTGELDRSTTKVADLESSNEELRRAIVEAEEKAAQSLSENSVLVDTNTQLKSKVNELQELLDTAIAEKEATAQQVASHVCTISELTEQHTRSRELHSAAEAHIVEIQTQLEETAQKFLHKELEVKELTERLAAIEGQMSRYEDEAREIAGVAGSRKVELEQTLLKLQDREKLVEELQVRLGQLETDTGALADTNMKLNEQIAGSESKLNDLQAKLSAALVDKEDVVEQLHSSKKAIEDLMQQLTSEREMFQSEILSIKQENQQFHETSAEAAKELKNVIMQLEEQLKDAKTTEEGLKAEVENLRVESAQKCALQAKLNELEVQFLATEAQLKEEVKSVREAAVAREAELTSSLEQHVQKIQDRNALNEKVQQLEQELQLFQTTIAELKEENARLVSEQEDAMKRLSDELEAKIQQVGLLEKQTKELQEKLQPSITVSSVKGEEGSGGKQEEGTEVKSRDIGSSISTPAKRKSKKKLETSSSPTISATDGQNQTTESSPIATIKFVLGVALVSIIFGIVLGKRY
ncbi:hypothetical protein Ancab_002851 [Ancistrocladus abbreviatus]